MNKASLETLSLLKNVLNFYNGGRDRWAQRYNFGKRTPHGTVDDSNPDDADCCCLNGALFKFSGPREYEVVGRAQKCLQKAIREIRPNIPIFSPSTTIVVFNDSAATYFKHIKSVLKRAIELEATAEYTHAE
jgi:hypothetical protein